MNGEKAAQTGHSVGALLQEPRWEDGKCLEGHAQGSHILS